MEVAQRTANQSLSGEGDVLIVVEAGGSCHYLNYALAVAKAARATDSEVIVVEIDSRHDTRFWYPYRSSKFKRLDRLTSMRLEWHRYLDEVGAKWVGPIDVSKRTYPHQQFLQATRICKTIKRIDDIPDVLRSSHELGRSVHSIMLQDIARGSHLAQRKLQKRSVELVCHYENTYRTILLTLNDTPSISHVVIPNGRSPVQAAALQAAEKMKRKVLTYEHGHRRGETMFLASWRYHDRLKFQEYLLNCDKESLEKIGRAELLRWRTDSRLNPYLRGNTQKTPGMVRNLKTNRKIAVYFLSSADEFVSSGPNWPIWRWTDQWEALDEVIPYLQDSGYEVILKQHPNLLNKSWRETACTHARASRYGVRHVNAFDQIQAAELLDVADLILTWGSTVGIEGISLGKPVWLLSHCHYDLTVDVRMWPKIGEPSQEDLEYRPKRDTAFVYYGFISSLGSDLSSIDPTFDRTLIERASKRDLSVSRFDQVMQRVLFPFVLFATPRILQRILRRLLGERLSGYLIQTGLKSRLLLHRC